MPKRIFVTRHRGAVTWAVRHGLRARKVEMSNFDVANVQPGDVVMGTLPVHLIAEVNHRGAHYWHLTMDVPESMRGKELSADDMEACGARLDEFRVVGQGARSAAMGSPEVWEAVDERPVLYLCIATGQTLPNVIPMLLKEWDRVVVFASPEMAVQAGQLKAMAAHEAARRGQDGAPLIVKLPADGSYASIRDAVQREMASLRKDFPDHRIVLNFTGGEKPMSLGFVDALRSQARLLYCNTRRGVLETIDPPGVADEQLPPDLLDIDTYLQTQGLRVLRSTRAQDDEVRTVWKKRELLTARLALELPSYDASLLTETQGPHSSNAHGIGATLHALAHSAVQSERKKQGVPTAPFQGHQWAKIRKSALDESGRWLLRKLVAEGLLLEPPADANANELHLVFANPQSAAYLAGGYMEEFAFLSAAALGLPPTHFAANVGFDVRNMRAGRKNPELNELDLALVWRNQLLIIECKAGRALSTKSQDTLNKSATLKAGVGGLLGTSWVLSSGWIERDIKSDLLERADRNRIEVLEGPDVLRELPERLAQWAGVDLPSNFRPWDKVMGKRTQPAQPTAKKSAKANKKS